jgi:hypothetical protein
MDYIIAADGVPMASESSLLSIIKKHHEARSQLKLTIYNMLSGLQRDLYVQPSDSWGGEGLLGLIIRFDTLKQAEEHAIHILVRFYANTHGSDSLPACQITCP